MISKLSNNPFKRWKGEEKFVGGVVINSQRIKNLAKVFRAILMSRCVLQCAQEKTYGNIFLAGLSYCYLAAVARPNGRAGRTSHSCAFCSLLTNGMSLKSFEPIRSSAAFTLSGNDH